MAEAERQAEAERNAAQQRARRQREAVREAEAARQRERADDDRVRQLNAERQRAFRAAQEEGARRAELEANAERLRQQRAAQDEEARRAELEANAERLRLQRAAQDEEARREELEANAERLRQQRAAQDEEARRAELEANAERLRLQRAAQDEEARRAELEANAERLRLQRAAQDEEARRAELEANAERLRLQRAAQDEEARRAELEANAERLRLQREAHEEEATQAEREATAARVRQHREEQDEDARHAQRAEDARRHQQQRAAARARPASLAARRPADVLSGEQVVEADDVGAMVKIYISDPLAEDPEAEAAIRLGHVRLPAATSAAVQHRLLDLLGQLQAMLRQVNPWVHDFIMAAEVLAREVEHRQLIISVAARPAGEHARRYNAAEGLREVAVLMGEEPGQHDLVLRRRADGGTGVLQTIDESHRACDPLHFVLLFPLGTTGWHPAIAQAPQPGRERQRMVTTLQFYAYRLQIRPHQDDSLHRAGRLFQEFVCMAYAKVEAIRLKYISTHQREIRADLYQSVRDAVAADAELGQQEQPEEGHASW
ncbi:plectin-like [Amphibalanus amphitrite]|uniref:plectin-like n=1 Tax=Amphibalanus amphitrite TaxID=1232801 RepID=UPI001C91D35F|nr:plectin-like [Amphibalanus amphitrite]